MTPTEALAQAIAGTYAEPGVAETDRRQAAKVARNLAALGYEVRPIAEGSAAVDLDVEALAVAWNAPDPDEPTDAEGFCEHGLPGGIGCSVYEQAYPFRLAAAYAAALKERT